VITAIPPAGSASLFRTLTHSRDASASASPPIIYKGLNQYHVVLEVAPEYQQSPDALKSIYVPSKSGKLVPLSAFAHYEPSNTALSVQPPGHLPAITLSFNLAPGASLGPAVEHIEPLA